MLTPAYDMANALLTPPGSFELMTPPSPPPCTPTSSDSTPMFGTGHMLSYNALIDDGMSTPRSVI